MSRMVRCTFMMLLAVVLPGACALTAFPKDQLKQKDLDIRDISQLGNMDRTANDAHGGSHGGSPGWGGDGGYGSSFNPDHQGGFGDGAGQYGSSDYRDHGGFRGYGAYGGFGYKGGDGGRTNFPRPDGRGRHHGEGGQRSFGAYPWQHNSEGKQDHGSHGSHRGFGGFGDDSQNFVQPSWKPDYEAKDTKAS